MGNRIEYIDNLKGFAILFVVVGHVLEKSLNIHDMPINTFYSSFHMPLFMFLSGIFAMKGMDCYTISEILRFIKKKTLRLMLPFIIVGGIYSIIHFNSLSPVLLGDSRCFWFLPALYYCMIVELIINIIKSFLPKDTFVVDLIIQIIIWAFVSTIYYFGYNIPYLYRFVVFFPFFLIGHYYAKYLEFRHSIQSSKELLSISILCFFIFLYLQTRIGIPFGFTGIFSIIIITHLLYDKNCPPQFLKRVRILGYIGKFSLEIYLFHWFLLPSLMPIGDYLLKLGINDEIINNGNFVLLLLSSLTISLPIIFICILISNIIRQSYFFYLIIFGQK